MDSVFRFQRSIEGKLAQLESQTEANPFAQQNSLSADKFEGVGMFHLFLLWIIINLFYFEESLQKLRTENLKLNYQIDLLKQNIESFSKQAKGTNLFEYNYFVTIFVYQIWEYQWIANQAAIQS